MAKTCVFCGKKPSVRTREHYIPRWLSILSEKDHVAATVTNGVGGFNDRLFNSHVVPACDFCNQKYGQLEAQTKIIFEGLLDGELKSADVPILLEWFDKTRVSIFLAEIMLEKEKSVHPNLCVDSRINRSDQYLNIQKFRNDGLKGIGIGGISLDVFKYKPSVFGLMFKDIIFLNYSDPLMLPLYFGSAKIAPGQKMFEGEAKIQLDFTGVFQENRKISEFSRLGGLHLCQIQGEFSDQLPHPLNSNGSLHSTGTALQDTAIEKILEIPRTCYTDEQFVLLFRLSIFELQYADLLKQERNFPIKSANYEQRFLKLKTTLLFAIRTILADLNECSIFPFVSKNLYI